jgi:hypothetical protein
MGDLIPVRSLIVQGARRRNERVLMAGPWPWGDRLPVKRNVSADGIKQDGHMQFGMVTRSSWARCQAGLDKLEVLSTIGPAESWSYATLDDFFDDGWRGD